MRSLRLAARLSAAFAAFAVVAGLAIGPATAHEERATGGHKMVVGWVNEPTFTGYPNGVLVELATSADQPITDLGDSLKVAVTLGEETTEPMALEPAFGEGFGTPGEYHANLIPTRPGAYTFHFTGTIRGEAVDESFTASDEHESFSVVEDDSSIAFPTKDPSRAELAQKLDRLDPRLEEVKTSAQQEVAATKKDADDANSRATIALIVGIVGIVAALGVGAVALGRRRA